MARQTLRAAFCLPPRWPVCRGVPWAVPPGLFRVGLVGPRRFPGMCGPARCLARALRQEAAAGDFADEGLTLETGGEDLPDAYRSVPVNPAQLRYNVIAAREPRSGEWRYLTAFAMLFGLSSSVMNFMRSAFLEAAARRVAALLHTMYVDDGNLGDL